MNKLKNFIIILAFMLFGPQDYLFGQDSIISNSDSSKSVLIFNKLTKRKLYYEYKQDYRIKDGRYIEEYPSTNGLNTVIECQYKNNLKEGLEVTIYNNQIVSKVNYKRGVLNGKYIIQLDSNFKCYGYYKNGIRIRKWKFKLDNKTIGKGKYSGNIIKMVLKDKKSVFILQNGDSISFVNHEEYKNFNYKFDYFIAKPNTWLRKGKWVFFNIYGEKIKTSYYNKFGELRKQKVKLNELLPHELE